MKSDWDFTREDTRGMQSPVEFVAFEKKYFGWHKNKKAKIIKFAPNKEEQ